MCDKLYVVVARLFLRAEQESLLLKCPMFQEHITEAIHCFNQAIKVLKFEVKLLVYFILSYNRLAVLY